MLAKKPKQLFDKDPWLLAEEIPDSDVFFFQIPMSCFCNDSSYKFLKNYKKVLTHYKKFHMDFYLGERDSFAVGESILKALLNRPNFGKDVNDNVIKWSYKLIDYARYVASLPLGAYSNKQLWKLYDEQDWIHTKLYTYGWLPVAVDMFHNNFTKKLKSYLYSVCEDKNAAEQAFLILTTPSKKTIVAQEREEFLKLYKKYYDELKNPGKYFVLALQEHGKKWGHLGYIYAGNVKPFDAGHYLKELKDLSRRKLTAEQILERENKQLQTAELKQQQLHKKYKISKHYQNLFETARDFALTKLVRRHAQLFYLYLMHNSLLPEIARRLNCSRYQVQFMLKDEVRQALTAGKTLSKRELRTRFTECVLFTEKKFEKIYVGKDLQWLTKNLGRVFDKNQREIFGQTAQPGFAKGMVKIILRAKDMPKMHTGDILVSIATDPDVVPAMKKAAAIVTEQGGITSHAAIVSRELGIPCIIGTKIATKVLKDGDMVEVDANKGIVKKL